MALWGKGDPRWIVEERPDSTNVNNWHWTERDATNWSTIKLKELFLQVKEDSDEGSWHVDEVKKVDGEATINNRKGKLIYFYEWDIVLSYKGMVTGSDLEHSGSIHIPNLSDENSAEDVDVQITAKGDAKNAEKLKHLVRKNGIEICREKCKQYIEDIGAEYSQGMVLPTPKSENNTNINSNKKESTQNGKVHKEIEKLSVAESKPVNRTTCHMAINLKEEFKTTAEELYLTLTQAERLCAFTRSQCISNPVVGGEFSLMNGNIYGTYVEVVPNKKIVQKWRFKEWMDGVYSTVTIKVEQKTENTLLTLSQTGVPDFDTSRTEGGWARHFWGPMKQTFGFGSQLLS